MAHARLGPSNHRWPNCPGSVREEAWYPDTSGAAAIDGTGTHLLLELCILSDDGIWSNALEWVGRTIGEGHEDKPSGWVIDKDRAERVQDCLCYLQTRYEQLTEQFPAHAVIFEAESHSNPGGIGGRDDWWGTVDITITVKRTEGTVYIEVVDYKDGRGWVAERNNSQLQSYWVGKARDTIASGPDKVRPLKPNTLRGGRVTIVQPKTHPKVRYQDVDPNEMIAAYERLIRAADATDDPNAPLVADGKGGKGYCRWCKHKPNCSALQAQGAKGVSTMTNIAAGTGGSLLDDLQAGTLSTKDMSNEQISQALDAVPAIEALIKSIKDEGERRATEAPGSVPGYEMGVSRGSRVWADDPDVVEKKLKGMRLKKDQIYPAKLASPAQIEKIDTLTDRQKKKLREEMITTMEGKPKLVKAKAQPKIEKDASMFAEQLAPAQEPQPAKEPEAASEPAPSIPSFL